MDMNKEIEQKLLAKNTNPTSMRILVYDFLEQQRTALSLTEIERHFYKADRVTIYRTLKTFEEKGIVHSIPDHNTTKYMLCHDGCDEETHQDWHLHFYCKVCKQTTCREDFEVPRSDGRAYRIDRLTLLGEGVCEACLNADLTD